MNTGKGGAPITNSVEPRVRVIIREVDAGFAVQGELYKTLKEAIKAAGEYYTFIPGNRS